MKVIRYDILEDVPNDAYTVIIYNGDVFGSLDDESDPTNIKHYLKDVQTKIRCQPNMLDFFIKKYSETDMKGISVVGFG